MTTEELALLAPGTSLYLPDGWYVTEWVFGGLLVDRHFVALLHPPDRQNATSTRRPVIVHSLELLPACLSKPEAWASNITDLHARINHIYNVELRTNESNNH